MCASSAECAIVHVLSAHAGLLWVLFLVDTWLLAASPSCCSVFGRISGEIGALFSPSLVHVHAQTGASFWGLEQEGSKLSTIPLMRSLKLNCCCLSSAVLEAGLSCLPTRVQTAPILVEEESPLCEPCGMLF